VAVTQSNDRALIHGLSESLDPLWSLPVSCISPVAADRRRRTFDLKVEREAGSNIQEGIVLLCFKSFSKPPAFSDTPELLYPDAVLKSLLLGLASGTLVRLIINSGAGVDDGRETPTEIVVSWVCDVSLALSRVFELSVFLM
jgi:hypothetical protein